MAASFVRPFRAQVPIPDGANAAEFIRKLAQVNEGMRIEKTSPDRITIMPPAGFGSSDRNSEIITQLRLWNRQQRKGRVTDSNTLFVLPGGDMLGPDAAWISKDRLQGVSAEEQEGFLARVPEFVIELRSPSDSLAELRRKMRIWVAAGVQLAWLLDPKTRSVEIYQPAQTCKSLSSPTSVHGEGALTGFVLHLQEIWVLDSNL